MHLNARVRKSEQRGRRSRLSRLASHLLTTSRRVLCALILVDNVETQLSRRCKINSRADFNPLSPRCRSGGLKTFERLRRGARPRDKKYDAFFFLIINTFFLPIVLVFRQIFHCYMINGCDHCQWKSNCETHFQHPRFVLGLFFAIDFSPSFFYFVIWGGFSDRILLEFVMFSTEKNWKNWNVFNTYIYSKSCILCMFISTTINEKIHYKIHFQHALFSGLSQFFLSFFSFNLLDFFSQNSSGIWYLI